MDTNNGNTKALVNKILLITCGVAAGLIIGIWVWKSVQISDVRNESKIEMQQLKDDVTKQIRKSDELHLRSIAKPLVWAVRFGMLKNNFSQVNFYANEMVKEKYVQKVVVANYKGIVILSTNKKKIGKEFILKWKINYLSADTTVVENINDCLMIMSSPVMGFNNRLGTLFVSYSLQHPELKYSFFNFCFQLNLTMTDNQNNLI